MEFSILYSFLLLFFLARSPAVPLKINSLLKELVNMS